MKKPLKRVARLSGVGLQLTSTIFLGVFLGQYLDNTYPISDKRIYTLILTIVAVAVGLYNTLQQINQNSD